MPSFIAKQPNGLFCRYSTVVDDFTHFGLTEDEAWSVVRDEFGVDVATMKVGRAKTDDMTDFGGSSEKPADGLNRWRYALEVVAAIHGRRQRNRRVREALGK